MANRNEVQQLVAWCIDNNLFLNTKKTKELIVYFRKTKCSSNIHIKGTEVESVNLCFWVITSLRTSTLIKKAHQCLFFLRRMRKANLSPQILVNFYRCTTESIHTKCITVYWKSTPYH